MSTTFKHYTEPINMETLMRDFAFLRTRIAYRVCLLAGKDLGLPVQESAAAFPPPAETSAPYDDFLTRFKSSDEERMVLLLALAPHLQAHLVESVILQYFPQGADLPELGGVKGSQHRGMMPTGETALFILAGQDYGRRAAMMKLFDQDHYFASEDILKLEVVHGGEPRMSGRILLSEEYTDFLLTGKRGKPKFSPDFPAKHIHTPMEWEDLVLSPGTLSKVQDIMIWIQYNPLLIEKDGGLAKRIKPGYRALFHGPPGTGKTLTAALLGKYFKKEVYGIDLSQVVSKFIGETEKNLEKIFVRAEHKDWILFFDEADALFGKRSNVQSAHDKYANQEVAYLLQRIENYSGLLILASNFKNNVDAAFARRFNTVIHFPMPGPEDRFILWKKTLPAMLPINFDCRILAEKYEISGASILNAIHFASLRALAKKQDGLLLEDLKEGIHHEFQKEDKFI